MVIERFTAHVLHAFSTVILKKKSDGNLICTFQVPKTCENFVKLCSSGYYDNTSKLLIIVDIDFYLLLCRYGHQLIYFIRYLTNIDFVSLQFFTDLSGILW